MDEGIIKEIGTPANVIDEYLRHVVDIRQSTEKKDRRRGSGDATIVNVRLLNADGKEVRKIKAGDELSIIAKIKFNRFVENPIFGLLLKNSEGTWVYGTNTMWRHMSFGTFHAGEEITVTFKQKVYVVSNVYYIDLAVSYSDAITFCEWWENAIEFSVETLEQTVGIANLDSEIFVRKEAWERQL